MSVEMESFRIVSEGIVRIRPLEPVFVVFEGDPLTKTERVKRSVVLRELCARTLVNGKEYRQRMSDVNSVMWFTDDNWQLLGEDGQDDPVRIISLLYVDAEEKDFLFRNPGRYEVVFENYGEIIVEVEPAPLVDLPVQREMQDIGIELALWLLSLGDHRAPAIADRVERLLAQYPDTVYKDWLGLGLAASKVRRFHYPEGNPRSFGCEKMNLAEEQLGAYAGNLRKSPLHTEAAFMHAEAVANAALRRRPCPGDTVAVKNRAITLLESLRDSPFALVRHREFAREKLAELTALQSGNRPDTADDK